MLVLVAAHAKGQEAAAQNIRGTWTIVSIVDKGETQLVPVDSRLVILEDKYKILQGKEVQAEFMYTVNASVSPRMGSRGAIGIPESREGECGAFIVLD